MKGNGEREKGVGKGLGKMEKLWEMKGGEGQKGGKIKDIEKRQGAFREEERTW